MSQTFTDNCYAAGNVGQTDLQNMENNFQALKTSFSGAAAPANLLAGMLWFDTTKIVLKYRDTANAAWLGIMHGDVSQKIWVYRNAAIDGWAIDAAVSDRVLALKGAGGLYNANGGTVAGETWGNLKAHTHTGPSHTHGLGTMAGPDHTHDLANLGAAEDDHSGGNRVYKQADTGLSTSPDSVGARYKASYTTGNPTVTALTGAMAADGTAASGAQSTADVRPAAALGTLQYLNL